MKRLRITVGNKTYDVTVEDLSDDMPLQAPFEAPAAAAPPSPPPPSTAPSSAAPESHRSAGPGTITSPLAGTVHAVLVKVGDRVEVGQKLVIVEAMKMENVVSAPVAGTVKEVAVKAGELAKEGQVLVVLE